MHALSWLRRRPWLTLVAAVAVAAGAGTAAYAGQGPSTPTFTPRYADQITNIDVLRSQIKNYYGDTAGTGVFAPDSYYAQEAQAVAAEGSQWLAARAKVPGKAIVLDVDDTTLATWNYEIASNWAYTPASNAIYVARPAVPGRARHGRHGHQGRRAGIRDLLPDR